MAKKKLSMSKVKEENKMYKEYVDIPVKVQDDEYQIRLHPIFSPTKVAAMVDDYLEFLSKCQKEKIEITDKEVDDLIGYFIIKHWTDIRMTTSKKTQTIYDEFKSVLDSDMFKQLLELIPQKSIEDVYNRIYDLQEAGSVIERRLEQFKEEIDNLPLENKTVFDEVKKRNKKSKQIPEV